jgi:GntR family galactonate operon transcriptional repressor
VTGPTVPDPGHVWPRTPGRLGTAVVAVLADQIIRGELAPGASLPTEPLLCEYFGVSRTVVREAVKLLEEKGLVRARQGLGTTVADPAEWNLLDSLVLDTAVRNDESLGILDDLVDVRVALECAMTRKAATRRDEPFLAELRAALGTLEDLRGRPVEYFEGDVEYHDVILRASGNRFGRWVIHSMHPHARASSRYSPAPGPTDVAYSHKGHVEVYEQILAGDPEGASGAMYRHIMGSWTTRKAKRDRAFDADGALPHPG